MTKQLLDKPSSSYQEQKKLTSTNPNLKQPAVCEECQLNPSKYKCPGCALHSCSLPCVKAHKQRMGCTGKRNQTQFVPLSQFDDNLLLSDYNLLEEVKRVAESAQRKRAKLCGYPQFKLPYFLRNLQNAARFRRTRLLFLPKGMSKREKNQSSYNQRKKFISWTIELCFHSTDVVLLEHGVHEDTNLGSLIEKHLRPGPWIHKLRQFSEAKLDCLKFFIRRYPKGPRSPYQELDITTPLRQQLANLVILEYPVIHIFLPSHSYDFEVVKDVNPVTQKKELDDSVSNKYPIQKGIPFREEEIEEDNTLSVPRVFDAMKNVNSSPKCEISLHNTNFKKLLSPLEQDAAGNSSHSISKIEEVDIFEDMEFDFDQGLIDAYSDLIAEINPDDFLDLEGEFEIGMEDENDQSGFRGLPSREELEEGEIQE